MTVDAAKAADSLLARYTAARVLDGILARFRGRSDVHALQFGGAPALGPVHKPITPDVLERHLAGTQAAGFYVCDAESRCWMTCADFDNKQGENPDWKEQVETLVNWLEGAGLYPFVEISQSGSGAHVWLAMEEPTDAALVRRLWKAAEERSGVKLKEIFPKQDRIKELGNLVRFPLWRQSCFVALPDWEIIEPSEALDAIREHTAADVAEILATLGVSTPVATLRDGTPEIPVGLPATVAKIVMNPNTLLGRRWANDVTGLSDPSPSGQAMAIARELVRRYVPTDDVREAVRYWMRHHGDRAEKADRKDQTWLDNTIAKAFAFVIEKPEALSFESTTVASAVDAYLAGLMIAKRRHYASGIASLDESIEGVAAGEVCVIAARPGHGKTAIALEWIDNASLEVPALIISEEMAAIELGRRRAMSILGSPESTWTDRANDLREQAKRYHAGRKPVHIVENAATVERVEELIDLYAAKEGVKIVAVDYLQLLSSRDARSDRESATAASKKIKQAAKRNGVAVLELCQLNRAIESIARKDLAPKMSDLRDSGQIEQDADLIIFGRWLHKDAPEDESIPRDAYGFYCAKRRNGHIKSAVVAASFNSVRQTFN